MKKIHYNYHTINLKYTLQREIGKIVILLILLMKKGYLTYIIRHGNTISSKQFYFNIFNSHLNFGGETRKRPACNNI